MSTDKAKELTAQILPARREEQTGNYLEVQSARAAQEVQAAVIMAKKFPRDTLAAYNRIIESCKRKGLAEVGVYAYPRGGELVTGPSIRMAEVLAQNFGNLDFGVRQLSTNDSESIMEAYCWDLETNVRQTRVFSVPHIRKTKKATTHLDDPRDIYEMTANQGARRLRACILGIIPGDIVEAAISQCDQTLKNDSEPMVDRIRSMIQAFSEMGVTKDMLEKRLGHKLDVVIEAEIVTLKKIFRSLKDGMSKREDFFEVGASDSGKAKELNEKIVPKPQMSSSSPGVSEEAVEAAPTPDPESFDSFSPDPRIVK